MNKTIVTGNLVADPITNTVDSGRAVANFTIASNFRLQSGEERTDYYKISLWEKRAALAQHLHKGSKVLVEGRVKARVYQSQDGTYRASLEMSDPSLEFLTPKGSGQAGAKQPTSDDLTPVPDEEPPF